MNERQETMWQYQVVPEESYHPDIGKYRTYGIRLESVIYLQDISADKALVEQLAKLFTDHQLSPLHLRDVIVDLLP